MSFIKYILNTSLQLLKAKSSSLKEKLDKFKGCKQNTQQFKELLKQFNDVERIIRLE